MCRKVCVLGDRWLRHWRDHEQARARLPRSEVPLVVDVDGTLLKGDLLHETVMQFLATRPFEALNLLGWLAQGRSTLKRRLAQKTDPHIETPAIARSEPGVDPNGSSRWPPLSILHRRAITFSSKLLPIGSEE